MSSEPTVALKSYLLSPGLYYASFIPLILVVLVFGVHAVQGLIGQQVLRDIVSVLGFSGTTTAILVFFAGIHDGAVTTLLIAKDKFFPRLPWWTVFVYAGVWPLVPRAMIWLSGEPFEWVEVAILATLANLAFWAHVTRPKIGVGDRH